MKERTLWLTVLGLTLAGLLTVVTACGDDDDDDDDDSSATYTEQCESLVDEYLGSCQDDETYRDSLMEECPKFDSGSEIEESEPALECMGDLDCDDFDDALELYQALLDCMGPAIQE